jgi:hypothetical protein
MIQRLEAGMVSAMRPRSPLEVRAHSSATSSTAPTVHNTGVFPGPRGAVAVSHIGDPSPNLL